jgi:type I restriction enzyme, R subunit
MTPTDDFVYEQRPPLYGGFSESDLVEQPAIDLFHELGWAKANLFSEFAKGRSNEGRESKREAHLPDRLRAALRKLNPGLPETALDEAFLALMRERSSIDPIRANGEFYDLLRDGVKVKMRGKGGALQDETIRVIDWSNPGNNDFLIANQVWFAGDLYTRRADLIGFVNGLPLLFLELKGLHRSMEDAYNHNLRDYRTAIPHVFVPCAFAILSNGIDTVMGAPLAPFDYFAEWKKIDREEEEGFVSLETLIRGICRPERFLDLVENFVAFEEGKKGLVKKVAKTHQFLGVNKAIAAVGELKDNQGRLGVFWHTQGSGKSLSMLFFARKVLRKLPGNWTFLVVTDRTELDDQIADTFSACGALVKPRQEVQAGSREHLKALLRGDERFIFTLIQKFGTETGEAFPVLSERSDIIVITDEAHRSQYDVLAGNMRKALPNAAFLGFTGTPLIAGEEQRTREVFGDYISIYDFAQSVADGATVPLYYESRLPELQLENKDLDSDIAKVLDEADLDEEAEDKLKKRFARAYHLITNDDRLEKVADDLVKHFSRRGYRGKAMFIAIDKATAVRMFDKVKRRWVEMIARERARLAEITDKTERAARLEQVDWLAATDMAVVVSQSQNEIDSMARLGLDIEPHRKRLVKENLDEKFKADNDPLRLVFVCAMWITGFDVPTCSTVYLDKPMRNHTLMQTIARANRVAPDKKAGLIVDYVGVFRNLKEALAIYGSRIKSEGDGPIKDKAELVRQLAAAMALALAYAGERGVDPAAIMAAKGFERQARLVAAREALLGKEEDVKAYLTPIMDKP